MTLALSEFNGPQSLFDARAALYSAISNAPYFSADDLLF